LSTKSHWLAAKRILRSTAGFAFLLDSRAVSWSSKKQPVVTLSTSEVEYIAAMFCACQCVWLRRILEKLGHKEENSTLIQCDSCRIVIKKFCFP